MIASRLLATGTLALVAVTLLAGCGSSAPARARPELAIHLCGPTAPAPCTGSTTAAQMAALRRALRGDPDVAGIHFRSAADQYGKASRQLPSRAAALLKPGDVPAAFVVEVRSAGRVGAVLAAFRRRPGVSAVDRCASTC